MTSPGSRFREALPLEKPLLVLGTVNAYIAIMAERTGFRAIYLSGAGIANSSYGLPDLGITTLENVLEDVRRITGAVGLPLLVDIDTGFGSAFNIARTIREMERAGAAAIHIEDQVAPKRCGHRPGKELVSKDEMVDRIKSAVDARTDEHFCIMARSDAFSVEGMDGILERLVACREAGADMVFPEALSNISDYMTIKETVGIPVLANMTEFGKTPLTPADRLGEAGVDMALFPLSANRAMNRAALAVMVTIREDGTQAGVLDTLETREELYDYLGYHDYEKKLDELFGKK